MKTESIAFAIAGMAFGLLAGWIIGTEQARGTAPAAAVAASAPAAGAAAPAAQAPIVLDEAQVTALKSVAEREKANPKPRVDLGNLYFDADRYDEAITWYGEALKLNPRDVDVSTDLGVSYYYTNQPDKALEQFAQSLKIDGKHLKTLLNLGIVRAFGKQDLEGATEAWRQVMEIAPESPEGQAAKRALDAIAAGHANVAAPQPGG
jgi:tetratricopeptide (TPR) repeat protein